MIFYTDTGDIYCDLGSNNQTRYEFFLFASPLSSFIPPSRSRIYALLFLLTERVSDRSGSCLCSGISKSTVPLSHPTSSRKPIASLFLRDQRSPLDTSWRLTIINPSYRTHIPVPIPFFFSSAFLYLLRFAPYFRSCFRA
jgi:hypothetical protein